MTTLIALECSGRVRDAFLTRGYNAVSMDIKPTERQLWAINGGHVYMVLVIFCAILLIPITIWAMAQERKDENG